MKNILYQATKPTYNIQKSWEYNYDHGPNFGGFYPPIQTKAEWEFLGHKVISPLGIAAGPLPNAKWLTTYAKLGYGSLIQKTVRSVAHKSHPWPNIVFIKVKGKLDLKMTKPLLGYSKSDQPLSRLSITNSFGNPCRDPKDWMKETKKTRRAIKKGQLFGVSVYGTSRPDTTLDELSEDYARTAALAKKAGAMFIEANLACPNVSGAEDPFLFKDPKAVQLVSKVIKDKIGQLPLVLKIGYFDKYPDLVAVLRAAKDNFEAVSAINTIPKKVIAKNGKQILPGRDISGVCGCAIKEYGLKMVKNLVKARKELRMKFEIVGVGGVMKPEDVISYLKAGANHVHSATAIMFNPYLAYEFQQMKNGDRKS